MSLEISDHAWERAIQENVSLDDIGFVLEVGYCLRRTGVIFCQVRLNRMPNTLQANDLHWRLVGTTIVLCSCGEYVITIYRNKDSFKKDKCKEKYNKKQTYYCPCCGRSKVA